MAIKPKNREKTDMRGQADKVPQGAKFKQWCETNGITVELIAEKDECSTRSVYRMFEGDRRVRRALWQALKSM